MYRDAFGTYEIWTSKGTHRATEDELTYGWARLSEIEVEFTDPECEPAEEKFAKKFKNFFIGNEMVNTLFAMDPDVVVFSKSDPA